MLAIDLNLEIPVLANLGQWRLHTADLRNRWELNFI